MASTGNEALLNTRNFEDLSTKKIVIVKTAWNENIVNELERGAYEIFSQHHINQVETLTVPGAVEIPFAIKQHARLRSADAYIAFACVIKGGTPHFDYVCLSITQGITQLNLQLDTPVAYGVLTVLNEDQAWERLGGEHGHKGKEAALTALDMLQLQAGLQAKNK